MTRPLIIEIFTTKECSKGKRIANFLSQQGIDFINHVIDADDNARAEAIMLDIQVTPSVKIGREIYKSRAIFDKDGNFTGSFKAAVTEEG